VPWNQAAQSEKIIVMRLFGGFLCRGFGKELRDSCKALYCL